VSADRLSPLDASFLTIEDAVSHMHIGSVCIFEGPAPPQKKLVAMISGKLALVPRYRQLVRAVPANLSRPVWVDDAHFNIDYHVRRSALPAPGGESELRRLVGRVMSQQLDRAKPLWEIWVVEGLEDGRWAMVCKTHHCLVDGVSGTELLAVMLELSPDPSPLSRDEWRPNPQPSSLQLVVSAVADAARSPYRQMHNLRAAALVPGQALGRLTELASGTIGLAGVLRPVAPTSLNGPIGPHRRWAWAGASVDDIRAVRQRLGGTFNDVVLAAITSGFRALLLARGEPIEHAVRTMVPVSLRPRDTAGRAIGDGRYNNRVSAMFADLPVHVPDAVQRLHAITEQMTGLKEGKEAMAGEALTALGGFAPAMLLAMGTRLVTRTALRGLNTVTTNVPGPQLPLYVRGRRLIKAFPYVPLAGQLRITVAIFSYDGQVNFGVTGDYDSVPDIEVLCGGIEKGLGELRGARAASAAVTRHRRARQEQPS
jgi:diacylglycerol O-acyltransferase